MKNSYRLLDELPKLFRLNTTILMVAGFAVHLTSSAELHSQSFEATKSAGGVWLYNTSVSVGYGNVALPPPLKGGGALPIDQLDADAITSVSATLGWNHRSAKSNWSVIYAPSFVARAQNSSLNSWSHNLSIAGSRELGHKWTAGVSVNASSLNQEQAMFLPSLAGQLASSQGTYDEIAQGVLTGTSSNPSINSALATAPLGESIGRTLFYGNQVLTTMINATVSYAYSSRLNIFTALGLSRMQHIGATSEPNGIYFPTAAQATNCVGVNYSLAPRTDIGVSVNTTRTVSVGPQGYAQVISGSFGRIMGRRWFFRASGGGGYNRRVASANLNERGPKPQYTTAATLGFKTYSHNIILSHSRGFSDGYGFGFDAVWSNTVGWSWQRPGSAWMPHASFMQMRAPGNFSNIYSWQGLAGIGRSLGPKWSAMAQYLYDRHGSKGFEGYYMTRNTLQIGISWSVNRRLL